MQIEISKLQGPALDWAVAKAEGFSPEYQKYFITLDTIRVLSDWDGAEEYSPSTNWAQGGPIIERERIDIISDPNGSSGWMGHNWVNNNEIRMFGPSPLIAAMRCYVGSRFGKTLDVPDELM